MRLVPELQQIALGTPEYPQSIQVLGDRAPEQLGILGNAKIFQQDMLALFSSVKCPASLILQAHDLAQELRQSGIIVISGFHAPVEKEVLAVLLGGTQPVVIVMARGLEGMRLPKAWQAPLENNRLLLVSPD